MELPNKSLQLDILHSSYVVVWLAIHYYKLTNNIYDKRSTCKTYLGNKAHSESMKQQDCD
jgi:hypothetical protein